MDQMENQIITENELQSIQFKLTDDHRKLINEIRDRIIILKKNKNLSINLQIVPERVSEAFCYIQKLADGSSDVLNLEEICHIHKLLGCSGKLREPASSWFDENNIGVNGYNPPTNESIEPLLSEYVKQYLSVKQSDNAFEKICSAYFVFEQIHPFGDGNGRTGRIICAWMMFKYGYGFLAQYIEKQWGNENKQHAEAFKSEIHHYLAWLAHPDYFNGVFNRFYFYFLKEMVSILNQLVGKTS
jgi:fido (protein-threonine AMPylation protein)